MGVDKVSIVIPVYNPQSYFTEALASIARQTFSNYEIIISDDSPDNSATLNLLQQFDNLPVTYIKNPGKAGIFENLNNAVKHASGELVQIFCQDDVMLPVFLEKQVAMFTTHTHAGMAFSRYKSIDENGGQAVVFQPIEDIRDVWEPLVSGQKAINYFFAFGCIPGNLSPVMIPRSIFEELGYFDTALPFAADFDYWIRVAKAGYNIAYNNQVSLHVRSHAGQASAVLGYYKYVPDITQVYRHLYNINTVTASKNRQLLHVNHIALMYFKGIMRNVFKGRLNALLLFKHLVKHPYSLTIIMAFGMRWLFVRKFEWRLQVNEC